MNKKLLRILGILIVILFIIIVGFFLHGKINEARYLNSENSFLLENSENHNEENIQKETEASLEETYSLVQITAGNSTGTALIWKKTDKEVILVSNKHILENGESVLVEYPSGNRYEARSIGLSNDYDLGFCGIELEKLASCDRNTAAVSCYSYYQNDNDVITMENFFELTKLEKNLPIVHLGVNTKRLEDEAFTISFEGSISDYRFIEEFYELMLVSEGTSQHGMSGGGIFTLDGQLIGILSGGEETAKEGFLTYSIPVFDIEHAYEDILNKS